MDVYAIITEKIINLLKQGSVPWRRAWTPSATAANLGDAAEPDEPRLVSGAVVREPQRRRPRARLLHGCGGAALCMQSGGGSRRSRPAHVARRA
jgi:hypothetical protein